MVVRTCLLISDDPDDHIEFAEALYEISDDIVLVSVSDIRKAIDLLSLKKCVPEFILLNLTIPEFEPDVFFDALNDDPVFKYVQVIAYGEAGSIQPLRVQVMIDHDLSYSELKKALGAAIGLQGK
jgi:hypothetical protein